MPALTITASNSIITGLTIASPAVANPITVTADGVITSATGDALRLLSGPYKLVINGGVGTTMANADGIYLGNSLSKGKSVITIAQTAEIFALFTDDINSDAISSFHATDINNAGFISGNNGVHVQGGKTAFSFVNTGYVYSSLTSDTSPGAYFAFAAYLAGTGKKTVTNNGTLDGALFMDFGTNTITNGQFATIIGHALDGDNNNIAIETFVSKDTVTNAGRIAGHVDLHDLDDKLTNTGVITGNVILGNGKDKLTNAGTISGNVTMGFGNDTMTNSGTIRGAVNLGDGNDKFTNTGDVHNNISMGGGNDKFIGGNSAESVFDEGGKDSYKLGGGNDSFGAAGGPAGGSGDSNVDTVDGGTGDFDAYDISLAIVGSHVINIGTTNRTDIFTGTVAAKSTAIGSAVGKDVIKNFEAVHGGADNDLVFGSAGNNFISGSGGADTLYGGAGNDRLIGDNGADKLIGESGADLLDGGFGSSVDQFIYTSLTDSTLAAAGRDTITTFGDSSGLGQDVIEFKGFGFNFVNFRGNLAFNGNGVAELRVQYTGADTSIIFLDADGNGTADMQIDVSSSIVNWDVSDFAFT